MELFLTSYLLELFIKARHDEYDTNTNKSKCGRRRWETTQSQNINKKETRTNSEGVREEVDVEVYSNAWAQMNHMMWRIRNHNDTYGFFDRVSEQRNTDSPARA
jgi:hypothetical protein